MPLGRGLGSLIPQQNNNDNRSKKNEPAAPVKKGGVEMIEVSKIVPNPKQPREYFSDTGMEDLVNSIKIHGILQPLVVSPTAGGYELIAGERRFRAAKLNGMKEVPAIIREVSDHEKLELALIENLQRQNLNPIEEAAGYRQLMDEFNFTQDEVSRKMGKSRPVVANMLRLLSLPDGIKKAVAQGKISASAGRVLAGVKDTEKQADLFKKMLAGLTVREGEITSHLAKPAAHTRRVARDPFLADLEDKLRGVLETKVDIKKSGKTGKIIIEFYSDEELKKLKDKLL